MQKKQFTLALAAAALAVAASATMATAPASAAPTQVHHTAAASTTTPAADWSITWMDEGQNFGLAGYGTTGSTVQLLDATGTVVQSTTTGSDEIWWLDGGAKDGFGGTVTVRQLIDGEVTDTITVKLADIPWP